MGNEEATRLLIGAPVCRREWIIDAWFTHVFQAVEQLHPQPQIAFLFVGGEKDPTFLQIHNICQEARVTAYVEYIDEPKNDDVRFWGEYRFHRMVELRNTLLKRVREIAPDYFLSLDTDVLLHPSALRNMFETAQTYDVVGGRCYMTPRDDDRLAPSVIMFGPIVNTRPDIEGVVPVDVVMAIKLMKPRAYAVDYKWDFQGEDLGIARNWKEAGVSVAYDGRVVSKHVMKPELLEKFDGRCGF